MASASEYGELMESILGDINLLNPAMQAEGHALWQREGVQGVALWADLLPFTNDMEWPSEVAAAERIKANCIKMNTLIEEDTSK